MKNIIFIAIATLIFLTSSFIVVEKRDYKIRKVVIDAGHGGKDPGCHGKVSKEAHVALAVATTLGKNITDNMPDVKVIYTRDNNTFVELHDRAGIANKNSADLFISIHCNSGSPTVYGSETYTMGLHTSEGNLEVAKRENSVILQENNTDVNYGGFDPNSPMSHILFANYQNAFIENSLRFADKVETQFKDEMGRKSRGVRQAGFLVLWKTSMPSALIEIGYLTNQDEEKYLSDKKNQSEIAGSIFKAFKSYKEDIEGMN